MADIISGTEMRAAILDELRQEVEAIREKHGTVPGLVTILVGENPASISYVTLKVKTALSLGFHEIQDNQPADVSEEALLALIDKYNRDPSIHGILVQLPLPKHIDENKVIYAIDPDKDVDGFHPVNLGRSRGRWPFQYRRQAHFRHARPEGARCQRHGDDGSYPHQRLGGTLPPGRHPDRRGWRSRSGEAGLDQARRNGYRRGRQPGGV